MPRRASPAFRQAATLQAVSTLTKKAFEDRQFRLGAGDFAWTGVGTSHAFRHTGSEPFRWLETQTPQFPAEYGTRNYVEWEALRAGR